MLLCNNYLLCPVYHKELVNGKPLSESSREVLMDEKSSCKGLCATCQKIKKCERADCEIGVWNCAYYIEKT